MEEKVSNGGAETTCERRKDVGVYLKKITERLQAYADKQGFNHDITYAQGKVLFFLHTHAGGECSMKEIETYLDVSHATVSGIISRLAEKGYVMREKSKTDSRAKMPIAPASAGISPDAAELAKLRAVRVPPNFPPIWTEPP